MSKTPRTDAVYATLPMSSDTPGDARMMRTMGDHARTLERELAAANAELARLKKVNADLDAANEILFRGENEAMLVSGYTNYRVSAIASGKSGFLTYPAYLKNLLLRAAKEGM